MSERPVRIDDLVEIDNSAGVVEMVGNRSTRIRRVDGVHMLVPNSQMLERIVVNWTLIDKKIRSEVRFRIDELFRENDIVIAFPQRDVHLGNVTPLEVRLVEERGRGGGERK